MIEIEGYDWPHEEATVTWSRSYWKSTCASRVEETVIRDKRPFDEPPLPGEIRQVGVS
jgi:hypothetical protein